jgi:hypothetical protein
MHFSMPQYATANRRVRPHGLDRLIMRASLGALLWARRRAESSVVSHEQQYLRRANQLAVQREQREAARRLVRVF